MKPSVHLWVSWVRCEAQREPVGVWGQVSPAAQWAGSPLCVHYSPAHSHKYCSQIVVVFVSDPSLSGSC